MKKSIILSLAIIYSIISSAQNSLFQQRVIENDLSKEEMWINLDQWISQAFSEHSYVVTSENREAGTISIKYSSKLDISSQAIKQGAIDGEFHSYINIEVDDNKYKFSIFNGKLKLYSAFLSIYDMNNLSDTSLSLIKNEIAIVKEVGEKYYNGSLEWEMNNKFNDIIDTYQNLADNTPEGKRKKKNPLKDPKTLKTLQSLFLSSLKRFSWEVNYHIEKSLTLWMTDVSNSK